MKGIFKVKIMKKEDNEYKQCMLICKTDIKKKKKGLAQPRLQPMLKFTRMLIISAGGLDSHFCHNSMETDWQKGVKRLQNNHLRKKL